eukprot:294090-Pleurochrysis_carterae.AAC.3
MSVRKYWYVRHSDFSKTNVLRRGPSKVPHRSVKDARTIRYVSARTGGTAMDALSETRCVRASACGACLNLADGRSVPAGGDHHLTASLGERINAYKCFQLHFGSHALGPIDHMGAPFSQTTLHPFSSTRAAAPQTVRSATT